MKEYRVSLTTAQLLRFSRMSDQEQICFINDCEKIAKSDYDDLAGKEVAEHYRSRSPLSYEFFLLRRKRTRAAKLRAERKKRFDAETEKAIRPRLLYPTKREEFANKVKEVFAGRFKQYLFEIGQEMANRMSCITTRQGITVFEDLRKYMLNLIEQFRYDKFVKEPSPICEY